MPPKSAKRSAPASSAGNSTKQPAAKKAKGKGKAKATTDHDQDDENDLPSELKGLSEAQLGRVKVRMVNGEVVFEPPNANAGTAENPLDLDDDAADDASDHTSDHDSWYGQPTKHNRDRGGNGNWITVREDEEDLSGSSSSESESDDDGPNPDADVYICVPRPFDLKLKPEASLEVGALFRQSAVDHPEWPWIMQCGAWDQFREMEREASVRQPDNFRMRTSNGSGRDDE